MRIKRRRKNIEIKWLFVGFKREESFFFMNVLMKIIHNWKNKVKI